jgi:hypothetical protein
MQAQAAMDRADPQEVDALVLATAR